MERIEIQGRNRDIWREWRYRDRKEIQGGNGDTERKGAIWRA